MGSRCETARVIFSNLLSVVFKVFHVSHYTRGSSTNTARTCGKNSLRALPPLKSPCSSIGRSSLYMFTEFYVRFIIIFLSSESRRGCEARATTPCGFEFSHKALTFHSREERGERSHRSAARSAEVCLFSSSLSGLGEVNSVGLAGDSLMRCLS